MKTDRLDLRPRTLPLSTATPAALGFLNKHLKASTDPMPALADYARIINFKQK